MGKVDAVFWTSAIFSREAMRVNHVNAHKYGDRKALGIYRIVAACAMLVIFIFLTLYEQYVTKNRFYFTFAWWVSLGTLIFFALSLVPSKDYFSEAAPDPKTAEDGLHPFFSWKVIASLQSFMLQAAIH